VWGRCEEELIRSEDGCDAVQGGAAGDFSGTQEALGTGGQERRHVRQGRIQVRGDGAPSDCRNGDSGQTAGVPAGAGTPWSCTGRAVIRQELRRRRTASIVPPPAMRRAVAVPPINRALSLPVAASFLAFPFTSG